MSPIYVRPAREQAEHDRLILFLEAQYAKQFEVLINKGESRDYALKVGQGTYFPDLILQEARKPAGVIEIETGESTNNLEALAQWVHFGRSKVPFFLYVPVLMVDAARRFCEQNQVAVTEIWTYRPLYDGFDLVRVFSDPQAGAKAGKGPVAKVVTMPKVAEAPKPQPAIEAVEEILARIGSREAARQASREAARQASRARAAKPTKTATGPAPVSKPVAKPGSEPKAAAPDAKPAPAPKPAAKVPTPAPVKPVKAPVPVPVKKVEKQAPVKVPAAKSTAKKAPLKKAGAKKTVAKKAVAKKAVAKPAAAKKPAAKAGRSAAKPARTPSAKAKAKATKTKKR